MGAVCGAPAVDAMEAADPGAARRGFAECVFSRCGSPGRLFGFVASGFWWGFSFNTFGFFAFGF